MAPMRHSAKDMSLAPSVLEYWRRRETNAIENYCLFTAINDNVAEPKRRWASAAENICLLLYIFDTRTTVTGLGFRGIWLVF